MKLTRAREDAILVPVVVAYAREQSGPRNLPADEPASLRTLDSFRAALRLDDPGLEAIIAEHEASGRPWPAWSKEVARV